MSPQLATVLTLTVMAGLFALDAKRQQKPSMAVWIPFMWLLILGSRSVSDWMNLDAPLQQSANDLIEGSPTDRLVYLLLMVSGCFVLQRRQLSVLRLLRQNLALTLFFLYGAVSVVWSDFPLVSAKRWFKGLGDPIMVLILLTEQQPSVAIAFVLRGLAFLLVPLSVLFIKYYPLIGRGHSEWTGDLYYNGVASNKNMLGYLLLVFSLYFICAMVTRRSGKREGGRTTEIFVTVVIMSMIAWLFKVADSKTPLICLVLGIFVLVSLQVKTVRNHFGTVLTAGVCMIVGLQVTFGLAENVVGSAGRDMTFTGRTDLWAYLIDMAVNPWVGAGFESFWLGERLEKLWAEYYFKPTQAHNGYLEVYLNLGLIGLLLLTAVVITRYREIRRRLGDGGFQQVGGFDFAAFGMAYLATFVFYNVTEGVFKALNFLFIIFLLIGIEYSKPKPKDVAHPVRRTRWQLERPLGVAGRPTVERPGVVPFLQSRSHRKTATEWKHEKR